MTLQDFSSVLWTSIVEGSPSYLKVTWMIFLGSFFYVTTSTVLRFSWTWRCSSWTHSDLPSQSCVTWRRAHTYTLLKIRKLVQATELIHCVRTEKRETQTSFLSDSAFRPSFTFQDSPLNPRSGSFDLPHRHFIFCQGWQRQGKGNLCHFACSISVPLF
jgi:hypothetical protein